MDGRKGSCKRCMKAEAGSEGSRAPGRHGLHHGREGWDWDSWCGQVPGEHGAGEQGQGRL